MPAVDTAVNRLVGLELVYFKKSTVDSTLSHPQGSVECPDYCDDSFSCVIKGPTNVFVTESKCEVKALASEKQIHIIANMFLD